MKRYEFDEHGDPIAISGGEWVRYSDHAEAMKRIAAAPVAQGLDVDAVMTKIQEFASTWAVVGGRFDDGTAMECAEECKAEIRAILAQAAPSADEKCRTCGHASHPGTSCVNVAPSPSAPSDMGQDYAGPDCPHDTCNPAACRCASPAAMTGDDHE